LTQILYILFADIFKRAYDHCKNIYKWRKPGSSAPKKNRFTSKEVYVQPVKGGVLLLETSTLWKPLLESMGAISKDFFYEREQPKHQQQ
jgi:hypothetical protein